MNINKLEHPERLNELNPPETLKKIGLNDNEIVCDIGAGTGIFTIAAAKKTNSKVYAVEINDSFIEIIKNKVVKENLYNIYTVKIEDFDYSIIDAAFDLVLLVTVLHEIDDKTSLLNSISNKLTESGRLAVIEFHGRETPKGPPVSHRLGKIDADEICRTCGYKKIKDFDLGENFYCNVYEYKNK